MHKFSLTKKRSILLIICFVIMLIYVYIFNYGDIGSQNIQTKTRAKDAYTVKQLEFWAISSEDNKNSELIKQMVSDFNSKNNSIHVNMVMNSDKYFYKIFSSAIASQTNPDISIMLNSQAVQFWDKGFLFSLNPLVNDIKNRGQEFYSNVLPQEMLYKQNFGIPLNFENYILLVRKDLLAKEGLNTPENLTEFLDALRKLKSKKITSIALPNEGYLSSRTLLYFILINGGTLFDQNTNVQLAGDKNLEVYKFLNILSKEGLIYNENMQLSVTDVTNFFEKGKVAAVLTTPTMLKNIYNQTDKDFIDNIEILSLKGFDNQFYNSGPIFTQALCVFKNSERKEEAQIFADWFCSEYSKLWLQNSGSDISSIEGGDNGTILNEEFNNKIFGEIIPSNVYPTYPNPNSVSDIEIEGTDVINRLTQELSASDDIDYNRLINQYQNEIDNWYQRFNR